MVLRKALKNSIKIMMIIIIIIIMIIINNSNKTYFCTMTISVIKTAIKEKKIKLGVISI